MVLNKARDNRFGATAVFVRLAAAFWLILSAAGGAWALDGAVESADTSFLSVDLIDVALPDSRGVEPSPFILWRNNIAGQYLIRILSLQHATGRQLGTRLDIALPAGEPRAILWSSEMPVFPGRGVEPSPFIIFHDFRLFAYPLLFGPDGTPTAGASFTQQIAVDPMPGEYATCLAEMPGNLIPDGMPRLFIGTDMGNIAAVVYMTGSGFMMYDLLPVSEDPVRDIELIPQYGRVILGALVGSNIYGYVYDPPVPGDSKAGRSWQQFVLTDPRLASTTDFDVFGVADQPLTNPDTTVRIVIADGSDQLGLIGIGCQLSGTVPLTIADMTVPTPVRWIAAGTLSLLRGDSAGVYFDPDYDAETGSGGCEVNITDDVADVCGYVCGDANGDLTVDIGDAVHLINYIFKSGPAPEPYCAGDADGVDGTNIDIGDAVYLINYIFKSGPPPQATCCP